MIQLQLMVLNYIDVLVDGQYVDELRNPKLKWRGSENQRVIDVKKSLSNNSIVTFEQFFEVVSNNNLLITF